MTHRDVTAEIVDALTHSDGVVWLTGAGLSVASGISPYRKSNDAVWANFITDWGTVAKFRANPHAWWTEFWLKAHGFSTQPENARPQPNAGHHAIRALIEDNPHHRVITQNIDGLHRASGVPERQLVEIHGRHDRFVCTNAQCAGAIDPVNDADLTLLERGEVPRCAICQSALRPLVLLFDESYDAHPGYNMREAMRALTAAQLVLFVGTSFSVGITDYAVHAATTAGARLVNINVDAMEGFANLLGPAEVTLPALRAAVMRDA